MTHWTSALFGPPTYTKQDAISDLLRFAPLTSTNGPPRQTPSGRSWRCRLARDLVLSLRGVPPP